MKTGESLLSIVDEREKLHLHTPQLRVRVSLAHRVHGALGIPVRLPGQARHVPVRLPVAGEDISLENLYLTPDGKIGGLPEKAANLINKTKDNAKIERIKDALINIIGHPG